MLAYALSLVGDKGELDTALRVYEAVRKERGEKIQNSASVTRRALHLPDGEEQRKRDAAIRDGGRSGGEESGFVG